MVAAAADSVAGVAVTGEVAEVAGEGAEVAKALVGEKENITETEEMTEVEEEEEEVCRCTVGFCSSCLDFSCIG